MKATAWIRAFAKKKFQGFGIDRSKQHPKLTGKKSSAD
jgi:hypothetical protein